MFRVYGCITDEHDVRLVLLAGTVCLLACYTAFSLLARASGSDRRSLWLGATAFVAGSGVWSTHFVAMLAFRPGLPIGFNVGLTALSVIIAIAVAAVGFVVSQYRQCAALGGAIVGGGVGAMHYTGMAALLIPAVKQWDPIYAHASILIGVGMGALAVWTGRRRNDLRARLTASGLLALAICGLHFTAMAAFSVEPDPRIVLPAQMIQPEWLAVALAAITLCIIALGFTGSVVDEHLARRTASEAETLRVHVTELEATKQHLEATTDQLRAALAAADVASKAKANFLAAMSHELRTPLNAVIGFAEMLSTRAFGPLGHQKYDEYIEAITSSGTHLLGLINDILDFSRLDAGRLELDEKVIDPNKVMNEALDMLAPQAAKADVRLSIDRYGLPALQADERRLRQVLLNLVANAIKFTPPGGEIRISGRRREDGIAIAVVDTGIGMAPGEITTALEHFGQIDNSLARKYEGAGLGLPLSKRLIELHGGNLEIESVKGKGTTVTVSLPAQRVLVASAAE